MPDLSKIMKQAQQMQQKMAELQEELAEKTVDSESGGGMVKVTVNGKQELVAIKINPEVIDSEDPEFLEDLIVAAVQEGQKKAAQMAQEAMGGLAGGMGLPPGMF